MRSRRLVLAVATALVLAGCTGGLPAASGPTSTGPDASTTPDIGTTTGSTTDAPATTSSSTAAPTLTPKPLPDGPRNLTRETAEQFARSYERAYKWNRERTNRTTDLTVNPVRVEVRNATGDGYLVHLEVGFSRTDRHDGDETVGDGFYTVNYLVDGTTVLRAEAGGQQRPGPDPRNGTVVEG